MLDRFVVTGSGRCGTRWMSRALTRAGIPCGHESVFHSGDVSWPDDIQADSSWMAATKLDQVKVPVVLMVRHPLAVVRSWVEIGFFSDWDAENPCHIPLRAAFPSVYDWDTPQDRALGMWMVLTAEALSQAELVVRLESLDVDRFSRVLGWAGVNPRRAEEAMSEPPCNRHEESRARTGVTYTSGWDGHELALAVCAQDMAVELGYRSGEGWV